MKYETKPCDFLGKECAKLPEEQMQRSQSRNQLGLFKEHHHGLNQESCYLYVLSSILLKIPFLVFILLLLTSLVASLLICVY